MKNRQAWYCGGTGKAKCSTYGDNGCERSPPEDLLIMGKQESKRLLEVAKKVHR